jgi:nucleobase:cation symporter-1, NCS1 family
MSGNDHGRVEAAGAIEAHSYDYIPERQRHGTARKQLPFWFMLNATLITLFTGAIGPTFGLGLGWTLLAVLTGSVFGTFFQAFHAAQGPTMGLPQMIQSRVQFGSRGSVLPLAAVVLVTGGFGVFYIQLAAGSLAQVTGGGLTPFEFVVAIVGTGIAIVGHHLLHRVERWLSLLMVLDLVLLTVAVLVVLPVGQLLASGAFVTIGFIAQFGAAASYQIAIAPIVSDYTRYLPKSTRTREMVAIVFGGTLTAAVWLEALGAAIASARPGGDLVADIAAVGNEFGLGLGTLTLILAVGVTTSIFSVSIYSATVTALSTAEAFKTFPSTVALRAVCLIMVGGLALLGSLTLSQDFLTNFNGFLTIMLYLLIPWTAVNLVDFYFVRRAVYSITDILLPDGGIYGRWGRDGIISYVLGFIVMIPFFSTVLYTGPLAERLDGADIAPIFGLVTSAGCYLLLMRRRDLAPEFALVATRPLSTLGEHPPSSSDAAVTTVADE